MTVLFAAALRFDDDALAVRDRVRALVGALGLDAAGRTRMVTAVSEHLREAMATDGRAVVSLEVLDGARDRQELRVSSGRSRRTSSAAAGCGRSSAATAGPCGATRRRRSGCAARAR